MNAQAPLRRPIMASVFFILCLTLGPPGVDASSPIESVDETNPSDTEEPEDSTDTEELPYHDIHVGLGANEEGPFMLISWTGKRRTGIYFKLYLLDDDKRARSMD